MWEGVGLADEQKTEKMICSFMSDKQHWAALTGRRHAHATKHSVLELVRSHVRLCVDGQTTHVTRCHIFWKHVELWWRLISVFYFQFGRTEVIDNTLNPDFVRKFILDYFFEERQNLRFDLWVNKYTVCLCFYVPQRRGEIFLVWTDRMPVFEWIYFVEKIFYLNLFLLYFSNVKWILQLTCWDDDVGERFQSNMS